MLTWVYSNLGTPASYRTMDGFGVHAYKWINKQGDVNYVKFQWKSQQGIKSLRPDQVTEMQGKDFNHLTNDLMLKLVDVITSKWTFMWRYCLRRRWSKLDYNGLDATKVWLNVPDQKVGTMTLNRLPENFSDTEQSRYFSPSESNSWYRAIGRPFAARSFVCLFRYAAYRLGANLFQLPVNRPLTPVINHNQNGF